ncbi:hypothetical protein [Alicyclobacillus sp.]|uniref:HesB/YadR/YfhF family protein n=1 Tax=Alicyclobacillus sp. TaxID=61169 RepID=UPI0025B83C36|nr:hypothetical protein [Alicyclobacillus sp.]MCL6517100.1 hypothetical protein [Alicyclobacillus sp.]
MRIFVSAEAAAWLKRELGLGPEDAVRVFARYGGQPDVHPGFSLGIGVEPMHTPAWSEVHHGVRVYVRDEDLWYFDGMDLHIEYDPAADEAIPRAVRASERV